jgi:hypothetical protein
MESREPHVWEDRGSMRTTNGWGHEDVMHLLQSGSMTACELIPWGSNYTFAVRLECDGASTLGVYKPLHGEAPLWDFPRGLYRREYAAYVTAELLGWDFVPPTVIRDGQHGTGSVQLFVEHEPTDYFHFRADHCPELQRVCVFDIVTNNADRKAGHCLKSSSDGRIWGIDHGLTFNVQPKLRTVIWDFGGEPIPQPLIDDLLEFRTDSTKLHELYERLDDCLSKDELANFLKRIDMVIDNAVFPEPYSRRSVPWPMY